MGWGGGGEGGLGMCGKWGSPITWFMIVQGLGDIVIDGNETILELNSRLHSLLLLLIMENHG